MTAFIERGRNWDKIEYIHSLQNDFQLIEMVLCIAEYGYFLFFSNYKIFLEDTFSGHPQAQNMYWDQAFDIYTSEQYSQLWRGLDMQPFGYLEARKSRKSKKYQWFDEMYIKEPIKTEPVSIKDIINKL